MGYYTNYDLSMSFVGDGSNINRKIYNSIPKNISTKLYEELQKMNVFEINYQTDTDFCIYAYEEWYDYEPDMCKLSKKFPCVLFTLYGDGEDSEDKWVEYFLNGMCQYSGAKISYEDFNPEKLKEFDGVLPNRYSYE